MSSSSSSSTNNVAIGTGASSRGIASPSAIFPNVITGPGSPPGNQPPVPNTIEQAFGKQRTAKTKLAEKAKSADTRQRIEEFLAAPTSHHDPLRTLSGTQLAMLSDEHLMHQALQVITVANVNGSLRLANGSSIDMRQCILEFATNSKVREGTRIRKLLRDKMQELREISQVERSRIFHDEDDIDVFLDDDFSSDTDGNQDFDGGPSSSVKRKLQATVAGATVGKQQDRSSDKRQHKPTERYGINVAIKDKQVLYATQNRTLKENRRLLMEPYQPSKRAPRQFTGQYSADSDPP